MDDELILSLWHIRAWAERMQGVLLSVSNRFPLETLPHPHPLLLVIANLISTEASGSWIISELLLLLVNSFN